MLVESTREYSEWFESVRDSRSRKRVLKRVQRLVAGNPGSHRYLGRGLYELKVDVGPGYRIYYSLRGAGRLVLLIGGSKSTQVRDIRKARELGRR